MKVSHFMVGLALAAWVQFGWIQVGPAHALGDKERGGELAETLGCLACHAENGALPDDGTPYLTGQKQGFLIRTMLHLKFRQFSAGKPGGQNDEVVIYRQHPDMSDRAQSLSLKDIEDIAAFYATRSCNPAPVAEADLPTPPPGVDRCEICHGGIRTNPWADTPYLSGQDESYLIAQSRLLWEGAQEEDVQEFDESRSRHHRLAEIMFDDVGDAELVAFASYYSQLSCPR